MEEDHHTSHIPNWKVREVEKIKELIKSYQLFGIVGIEGIPAKQFQKMRRDLQGTAYIKVARNTLIKRALEELGAEFKDMDEFIEVQTALVFSNENPFKLYKLLEKNKTPSPIRAGAVAPQDIVVEARPTSFPPGPILGELQRAGIPAAIDGGKVVVKETKTVLKQGETVPQLLASMLNRLEIYPIVVGLDLRAVMEKGSIFRPDVLAIDETQYFNNITLATQQAFNLSVYAAYPTADNITTLISKASTESRNFGINAAVFEPELIGALMGKAQSQMLAVAAAASSKNDEAVDDELKQALGAAAAAATVSPTIQETVTDETAKAEKEEKEENSEESGMAGLGALFG
ncbi:MAG: 50S ribosomal protein L10 [Methanomethylovorans sp.]|nr:50S ribosomal protein L10 [Methanomethylovorans sp.]